MKNKFLMIISTIIGFIGIILPYVEIITNQITISGYVITGSAMVLCAEAIRKCFHRGDQLQKIFEKLPEENKTKLFNYAKELEDKK